jgi:hypothetical protein
MDAWPAEWSALQTVVVTDPRRARSMTQPNVVATPLDMIARLEDGLISTVVLTSSAASRGELASFLLESYPDIRVERG